MYKLVVISVFLFVFGTLKAQDRTQTIQGKVSDSFTGTTLPGVNIIIQTDSLRYGTVTNKDGYFFIDNIKLGKYTLTASFIGYKSYFVENIELISAQSINLNIKLSEATEQIGEVSVRAYENKNESINKMALVGARSFTLEETNRYPGSYGDPARMAINYAGVLPISDNRNDIIIRGNSASGVQWRLDNIEIPNPNHFGASGTTGGPVTIINTNLLSRSDFFTGAFPAEYGNAIAGVFDLKLKASNLQKHEKWVQLGWNGLEFGAEGPLKKGKLSSYMFSYRHSITEAMYATNIMKDNISYQDLTFKFNFPKTKTGTWSLIGMGGNSSIILDDLSYEPDDRVFRSYGEKLDNSTSMGVLGLTNKIYPNKKSKITTTLSGTAHTVCNRVDTFSMQEQMPFLWATENTKEYKLAASTKYNYKFSARTTALVGLVYNHYILSFDDMQYHNGTYTNYTDTSNATTDLLRVFASVKHKFAGRFESYLGLHAQYFFLNQSKSIEPRLALKFLINEKNNLSYGIGLHSQIQPMAIYYVQTETQNQNIFSNKNLDFTKSLQNVLAYNLSLNKDLRIKIEAYYQYLYNVPIRTVQPEYSIINFGTEYYVERKDSLANTGTAENYGLEFTLEQFLHKGFYYLLTASLFESNYLSSDHIRRSTAYNGKFAFNALAGYERRFPKSNVVMNFAINLTYAGGSPYIPFDQEQSVKNSRTTYDWENAYTVNRENYKRFSFRVGVKRAYTKITMETTVDFQYRTNYTSLYHERIDVTTGEIINTQQMGFYPMANLKVSF